MKKHKPVSASRTILSDMILPSQANPQGNVHGGEIMKIMDNCAGVAAMRHAHRNCVTARVDELLFIHPVYVGELLICEAQLVYVGRTSMEIEVKVFVEDLGDGQEGEKTMALTAFFTFVALDKYGKPCEVPALDIETEEERAAFREGEKRYLRHKKHKPACTGL